MKREINVFDYSNEILQELKKGILITTKAENQVNTMTISWGSFGIEWSKPIFIAYIREKRHTKYMLDKNAEFTINIPVGEVDRGILKFAGTKSGKDVDKIKELNLTLVESDNISVPAIKELPLTLECKVVYVQKQDKDAIAPQHQKHYPQDVSSDFYGGNKDYHIMYYGEIVNAYIIE